MLCVKMFILLRYGHCVVQLLLIGLDWMPNKLVIEHSTLSVVTLIEQY